MTDADGNIVVTTDPAKPIIARDDSRAGPFILSSDLYYIFHAPEATILQGHGFGDRILYLVLSEEANATNKFFFKLVGIDMAWKEFIPVFFMENNQAHERDLSLLTTFGWKLAASLGEEGIGFIRVGYQRYAVGSKKAAKDCIEKIFK
jgi:hypothetical protein